MSLYLEYIFRKENLHNCVNFPFSIHLKENDNFKIITCKVKKEKFIIKTWHMSEYYNESMLPRFEEIETDNFINFIFDTIDPNNIRKINEISYTRNKLSNNMLLEDVVFESYYKLTFFNNIKDLNFQKRNELFKYFLSKENCIINNINFNNIKNELTNNLYLKWQLWEKYLIKNMFPGEFMFYSLIRN